MKMDENKLNKPVDVAGCASKHIGINCKSGDSVPNFDSLASTSSLKTKKSLSLLSTLVRRSKLRSKKLDEQMKSLQQQESLKLINSSSTTETPSTEDFDVTLEKIDDQEEHIRKEDNIKLSDSENSLPSSTKVKRRFFSKFLKKHVLSETSKKKANIYAIEGEQKKDQAIAELKHVLQKTDEIKNIHVVPTSFIHQHKPSLSSSLMQGLVAVQNLASRLQQSEGHLIQVFTKYITDSSLQKEFLDTLCMHSRLHLETERMNNILSMEMWLKQTEIAKIQESAIQEALNSVIRQNRQLQSEYEMLFCTYERLLRKFKKFNERDTNSRSIVACDPEIQDIIKHNIRLTQKMELSYQQIENLESELTSFKLQNEHLEHQFSSSVVQLHDLEAVFHRTKADYELEIATLNHQLKSKEKIVINAINSCNKLKKDLDGMEDQLRDYPVALDWNKLKCHEEGLSDFIELGRICINEMSKELIMLRNQICTKDKKIDLLLDTNEKLQENLKNSLTEMDGLSKKIDESGKILAEHKYKCLEADMKMKAEKLERLKMDNQLEKNELLRKIAEYENNINEKIALIDQGNAFIANLNSENMALHNQIDSLNRLLRDSGSGDIVKELNINQEQIRQMNYECHQLLNEKQQILGQLNFLKEDHKKISDNQDMNIKQIQKLQMDVEKISSDNRILQQKYDSERQTVMSLQTERKKYLSEKALIKSFFHHMKSEITRLQKLEGTVTDISKEANKLAMVAEYNKQVGKKLKSEIEEKDKTIVKLRNSVEKLNDIQLKNTKEKLSLCHELSELCQVKEKLNTELSWEVQKNMALDDAKNEIVETTNTQLLQYEEFHKKERNMLKDLLKDFKTVVKQRNSLIAEKESLIQESKLITNIKDKQVQQIEDQTKRIEEQRAQIEEYRKQLEDERKQLIGQNKKFEEQSAKIHELDVENKNKEYKNRELEKELEDNKITIAKLQDKLVTELKTYDDNVKQIEQIVFELRKEKGNLEDTVKYLQNNTQKLHCDLNVSRGNEKDLKDALNECLSEKKTLEETNQSKQREIESLNLEKEKFTNEINRINLFCEKILADFEVNINSSIKKEDMYKKELNESQNALLNVIKENEDLTEDLSRTKNALELINEEFTNFQEQHQKCKNILESNDNEKAFSIIEDILSQKENLENENSYLKKEYAAIKEDLRIARQECESLYRQMRIVVEQKRTEIANREEEINQILNEKEEENDKTVEEISCLKSQIEELNQKLDNERSSYAALSQIHKEISTKFIKSIKDIVDEKNVRQESERKLKETVEYLDKLKIEKDELRDQVNQLLKVLDENKNRIKALTNEKEKYQHSLTDIQKRYNEVLKNCIALENQVCKVNTSESDLEELKILQKENERLKKDSEDTHNIIMSLQKEIGQLQQQLTALEFQKSEGTLRLHEIQKKFETEHHLCQQLKNIQKIVLAEILRLKDDGVVDEEQCNCLINLIKNESTSDVEDKTEDSKCKVTC